MRPDRLALLLALVVVVLPAGADAADPEPEIVSVRKIWDRAPHNAFTDLIRWRDAWFCAFREADAHVGGDGTLRVLTSTDGDDWESATLIAEEGIDLRDPKLSVAPDDRLMMVAGGSVYGGTKTLKSRRPRVAFSKDGREWTAPVPVLDEGDWLWRVTWRDGTAYGTTYKTDSADWSLGLVSSRDGVHFDRIANLEVPGHPNETTLRFLPDGTMIALVRREAGDKVAWIGSARPPYIDWKWRRTGERVGGPNFLRLPDGSLWAAGRHHGEDGPTTVLARMGLDHYEPALTLPSGGDSSYPGLAWHDGLLWISYYASHEGKSSIYLAKVRVPVEGAE